MFCFVLCTPQEMLSLLKCITLEMTGFFKNFVLPYCNIDFVFKVGVLAKSPHLNPFYCLPTQTLMESKVISDVRLIYLVVPNNGVRGIIAKQYCSKAI